MVKSSGTGSECCPGMGKGRETGKGQKLARDYDELSTMATRQKTRTLEELRGEIDKIDDALHDLVMRRASVSGDIARAKNAGLASPHRPWRCVPRREAATRRRLAEQHRGSMPLHAMVCLWRNSMSASLQTQTPFILHADAPQEDVGRVEGKLDLGDLAHAYFGGLTRLHAHKHISHVVHACAEDSRFARHCADPARRKIQFSVVEPIVHRRS